MFYKVEQGDKLLLIKWKKKKQNKLKKKNASCQPQYKLSIKILLL